MATLAPVEVGARGTVASLVIKEIEYFHRLEMGHGEHPKNTHELAADECPSSRSRVWPGFKFWVFVKKKKKSKASGGFLPRMCSMVEVENGRRKSGVSGFSYRNLKHDANGYEV